MKRIGIILTALFISLLAATSVFAAVGVGVGTGQIVIDETLRPGVTYILPDVLVFNTGDVPSDYTVTIEYGERDGRSNPPKDWFSFEPETFFLEPGESQAVTTTMVLPLTDVLPADYFAFVTAQPVREVETGVTSVGVAAGTKLLFTVQAANIIQAIYFKVSGFFLQYHPWSTIILVLIVLLTLLYIFKKKFRIQVVKNDSDTKD